MANDLRFVTDCERAAENDIVRSISREKYFCCQSVGKCQRCKERASNVKNAKSSKSAEWHSAPTQPAVTTE